MKLTSTLFGVATALVVGSAATAATVNAVTEGQRDQVAGTSLVVPTDAASGAPGFDLGSVSNGENIDIHGRVVTQVDVYTFTTDRVAKVEWIFGGYDLELGGSETDSGLVAATGNPASPNVGQPGSDVDIFFDDGGGPIAAAGNTFSTDIIAGDPLIAVLGPGTYSFHIDGSNQFDALYDIRISAVPLPAGAVLLLTGLAGLGIARRRRG